MRTNENATIKEIIEYGLETLPDDKVVCVNLKDLVYIHQVLAEYMRFFHQPMHYPKLENVTDFLGDKCSSGGFEVLDIALRQKIDKMLPLEIEQMMDEGIFKNPKYPNYYNENRI